MKISALIISGVSLFMAVPAFADLHAIPRVSASNAFLLLIPVAVWNIALNRYLPMDRYFPGEAPKWITIPEAVIRTGVFIFPLFLTVSRSAPTFPVGLGLYVGGSALYYASWLVMIRAKDIGPWPLLTFAPAYTPALIFAGMALMSESPVYLLGSLIFIGFHVAEYIFRLRV